MAASSRRSGLACARSIKSRAYPRSALRATATEGGCAGFAADGQFATAGASGVGGGGNAELLRDLKVATLWAAGHVALAANQGLKGVIARLAMKFVKLRGWNDSSFGRNTQRAPWVFWKAVPSLSMPGTSCEFRGEEDLA